MVFVRILFRPEDQSGWDHWNCCWDTGDFQVFSLVSFFPLFHSFYFDAVSYKMEYSADHLARYMHTIETLKKAVIQAGKKPYLLAIGNLNAEKLGNFPEIDVFVHIGCPESVLDLIRRASDVHRPVVTPFELQRALNPSQVWTGATTRSSLRRQWGKGIRVQLSA